LFADFSGPEMLPHAFAVRAAVPFLGAASGDHYFALHPVSWNEATVLERRFPAGIDAGQATLTSLLNWCMTITLTSSRLTGIYGHRMRRMQTGCLSQRR